MGARDSAGTREWARLRGDVDVMRGRLQSLLLQTKRLVEDLEHALNSAPFTSPREQEQQDGS